MMTKCGKGNFLSVRKEWEHGFGDRIAAANDKAIFLFSDITSAELATQPSENNRAVLITFLHACSILPPTFRFSIPGVSSRHDKNEFE
jgi:hypothetical protein